MMACEREFLPAAACCVTARAARAGEQRAYARARFAFQRFNPPSLLHFIRHKLSPSFLHPAPLSVTQ